MISLKMPMVISMLASASRAFFSLESTQFQAVVIEDRRLICGATLGKFSCLKATATHEPTIKFVSCLFVSEADSGLVEACRGSKHM